MMGNNTTSWNSSDSRKVAIKVTGVCRQDLTPKSVYTIIVPYSRLSQTIQQINRLGGQIVDVSVRSSVLVDPSQISTTSIKAAETETSKANNLPVEAIKIAETEIIADNLTVEPISTVLEEVTETASNQLVEPESDENLSEAQVSPEILSSSLSATEITTSDAPKALSKTKTKLRKEKSRLKEAIAKHSKDEKSKKKSKNKK